MKFVIEQIALAPPDKDKAIELLSELGLDQWVQDLVSARGKVRDKEAQNNASLNFNYQAAPEGKLELEVLSYIKDYQNPLDANWIEGKPPVVSHLGMHVTTNELLEWRKKFADLGIKVAQEVFTNAHTNPAIAGKRLYNYVIMDTKSILGVDLKFIVRYNAEEKKDD